MPVAVSLQTVVLWCVFPSFFNQPAQALELFDELGFGFSLVFHGPCVNGVCPLLKNPLLI